MFAGLLLGQLLQQGMPAVAATVLDDAYSHCVHEQLVGCDREARPESGTNNDVRIAGHIGILSGRLIAHDEKIWKSDVGYEHRTVVLHSVREQHDMVLSRI